jgi:hypothetical protein
LASCRAIPIPLLKSSANNIDNVEINLGFIKTKVNLDVNPPI